VSPIILSPSDDPYFTIAELRATYPSPLSDATKYPDGKIDRWRLYVEERIEHVCDVAFVPRTATDEVVSGDGTGFLNVKNNRLRTLTAAHDENAQTVDLTGYRATSSGFYLAAGWATGVNNLTVTYTHGYDAPPLAIKEAAMTWCRELVVDGPITARATQIATEDGPINLATPGMFGSVSGIPVVDQVIGEYRERAFV
jgi:hypothetical protein